MGAQTRIRTLAPIDLAFLTRGRVRRVARITVEGTMDYEFKSGANPQLFVSPKFDCLCGGRGTKVGVEHDPNDRDTLCECVTSRLPAEKYLDAEVVLVDRNELPWARGRSMEGA